jgi:hypothetical protein
MFVTALAAGLLMFADTTPAAAPEAPPATQTASAKPEMKKVCTKVRATDSNMPRTTCKMVPVKDETEEAANTTEKTPSPQ